jgi:hypothetical protein
VTPKEFNKLILLECYLAKLLGIPKAETKKKDGDKRRVILERRRGRGSEEGGRSRKKIILTINWGRLSAVPSHAAVRKVKGAKHSTIAL